MTKRDFLQTLEKRLGILPKAERDETIAYYRELIEDMMEEGCSEQEAVSRLEDIDLIVGRILGEKGAAASAEPARHKGGSCLRAFLIGAVALIIIALILSYAGVAVVGKVFDGLRMQNTAEKASFSWRRSPHPSRSPRTAWRSATAILNCRSMKKKGYR